MYFLYCDVTSHVHSLSLLNLRFIYQLTHSLNRLVLCGIYYYFWIKFLPKYKGYELRQTVVEYENNSIGHKLVKVPKDEVARWDREHDAVGNLRQRSVAGATAESKTSSGIFDASGK
jgi:hypothetical protein